MFFTPSELLGLAPSRYPPKGLPLATLGDLSNKDLILARSRTGQPQQQSGSKFARITHVRCPACEDEGNLSNEGRSRVVGGGQLRGASKYVGLTKASTGCELCDGSGSIETTDRDRLLAAGYDPQFAWMDPYALKK